MALPQIPRLSILACALLAAGFAGTAALAQTPNAGNAAATRLDAIRVTGSPVEHADGPVEGYRATRSATATRTDTPIEEIPQSIAVVPAEVIEDLQLTDVRRALDFAGSVTPDSTFAGMNTGSYTVRGFLTGAVSHNGFVSRGDRYLDNSGAPIDPALVERIEVLKGPASGLYGYSDPGGLVNIVSKRPQAERFSRLHANVGSWDFYRATVDMNQPLTEDGRLLSRINIVTENRGSFRNTLKTERQLVNPQILWQLGEGTQLFVNTEFSRSLRPYDVGIYAVNGNWRAMSNKTWLGEFNDGPTKLTDQIAQVILTHAINPNWDLRVAGQYKQGTWDGFTSETRAPGANGAPPNIAPRFYRVRAWKWNNNAAQVETVGRFDLGGWRHQLLVGVEMDNARNDARFPGSATTPAYGIDIYNPVYGNPNKPPIPDNARNLYRVKSRAFNLQDQINFTDNLSGQFGARAEHFRQWQVERTTRDFRYQKRTAFVPRGGLIYKINPEVSIYGNVAASFQPNGVNRLGQILEPEKGLGYETGFKFDWLDGRLGATVAAFHITKRNISLPDPADNNYRITAGEAVSKGVDMQVSGQITPALRLIGAYAYISAKVTKDHRPGMTGELANVPRHNASLLGVYAFEGGASVGTALTYRGARRTQTNGTLKVPAYTTVDMFTRWDVTKNINVSLNLNNVFDRWHLTYGTGTRAIPGEPRNVKLGVTMTL